MVARTRAGGEPYEATAAKCTATQLAVLDIALNPAPSPFDTYVESAQTGYLLYFSGILTTVGSQPMFAGKIGRKFSDRDGKQSALNLHANHANLSLLIPPGLWL